MELKANTLYRYKGRHDHTDALVYYARSYEGVDLISCGVICVQRSSVNKPGDNLMAEPGRLTRATEADFNEFRVLYPQGYDN